MFPPSAYHTSLHGLPAEDITALAAKLYEQVFRSDFTAPGVALISLGAGVSSHYLRELMVTLKEALDVVHRARRGRRLSYLSLARFDQQVTTKFHLDGAPDEAYLMLGYEPTAVVSRLSIADYIRAAHDWGLTPKALLADRNPMFANHEAKLLPYITELQGFDPAAAQFVLLNNSSLPYRADSPSSLGVMHQATIMTPLPHERRIVNSTMIGSANLNSAETIDATAIREFVSTSEVAGTIGQMA
jgi:hypothetical protein